MCSVFTLLFSLRFYVDTRAGCPGGFRWLQWYGTIFDAFCCNGPRRFGFLSIRRIQYGIQETSERGNDKISKTTTFTESYWKLALTHNSALLWKVDESTRIMCWIALNLSFYSNPGYFYQWNLSWNVSHSLIWALAQNWSKQFEIFSKAAPNWTDNQPQCNEFRSAGNRWLVACEPFSHSGDGYRVFLLEDTNGESKNRIESIELNWRQKVFVEKSKGLPCTRSPTGVNRFRKL